MPSTAGTGFTLVTVGMPEHVDNRRRPRSGFSCERRLAFTLLLALCAPESLRAQQEVHAYIDGELAYRHFHYRELGERGNTLDTENGFLPGVQLRGGLERGSTEIALTLSVFSGTASYNGQTNTGFPLTTKTSENFSGAHLGLAQEILNIGAWKTAMLLGYEWRQWDRDIQASRIATGAPVTSLYERYRWQTASAGLRVVRSARSSSTEFRVCLLRTLQPTVLVKFPTGSDPVTLEPGGRLGAMGALTWRHPLRDKFNIGAGLSFEYYRFGRSESLPLTSGGAVVGAIYEPRSDSMNWTLGLNIERRF